VEPIDIPPIDRLHGLADPYTELLARFDQRDRTDLERAEQWALAEARHNDRLRTAGQRLVDELKAARTADNRSRIDDAIAAWVKTLTRT
jgi:NADP-dependent 3-hydroxy acid dehydrogenase YdfG